MPMYSRFDMETGRFLGTRSGQPVTTLDFPGELIVEGDFDESSMFDPAVGDVVARPAAAKTAIVVSAEAVRIECARRLIAIYGARDRAHVERLIADDTALLLGGDKAAGARRARVAAHDVASKALRAMQPIPDDFTNDRHWP